jgi:F0F1-type ATP synthase assembly protein I
MPICRVGPVFSGSFEGVGDADLMNPTQKEEQPLTFEIDASRVQAHINQSRFIGYIGTQLSGILIPALIFQLSNSLKLAGLAIVVEWVPKLFMYLGGGAMIQRMGSSRTHIGLDAMRLLSLLFILLVALDQWHIGWVVAAAVIYQSTNALSNILFETSITRWWEDNDRIQGHSSMMKMDQLGALLGLVVGYLVGSSVLMCVVALFFQLIGLFRTLKFSHRIYPEASPQASHEKDRATAWRVWVRNVQTVLQPCFLKVCFVSICVGLPSALLFCFLAFHIQQVQPDVVDASSSMALIMLLRCAILAASLQAIDVVCKIHKEVESQLVPVGLVVLSSGEIFLMLAPSLLALTAAILWFGLNMCFLAPWIRSTRQKLIEEHAQEEDRPAITGLLIAIDALAYLMVGLLGFLMDLKIATQVVFVISIIGSVLMFTMSKKKPEDGKTHQLAKA